jgi:hypothetical protein
VRARREAACQVNFVPKPQTYKKPTTIHLFGEDGSGRVRDALVSRARVLVCSVRGLTLGTVLWHTQRSLIDRMLYDKFEEDVLIKPGRYFPPDVRSSPLLSRCVALSLWQTLLTALVNDLHVQIKCCLVNETTLIPVRFVRLPC